MQLTSAIQILFVFLFDCGNYFLKGIDVPKQNLEMYWWFFSVVRTLWTQQIGPILLEHQLRVNACDRVSFFVVV